MSKNKFSWLRRIFFVCNVCKGQVDALELQRQGKVVYYYGTDNNPLEYYCSVACRDIAKKAKNTRSLLRE